MDRGKRKESECKMIEVVFSESAKGGLLVAQHCGDSCIGGAVSVCLLSDDGSTPSKEEMAAAQKQAEESVKKAQGNAVSLGGNREDVFCFSNDLSTGDISGDCVSQNRLDALTRLYALFPEECAHCLDSVRKAKEKLNELIRRSSAGEAIRIWYSEQPYEYCGMCWLISELNQRMPVFPRMTAIKLPNRVTSGDTIVNYMGWGGVCSEEFYKFLPLEREVIPAFVTAAVSKWGEMQAQNAPLRAMINGSLQSVPEDFYDPFIQNEIAAAEDEFHEAHLIGSIMGKYQLGIGDVWIALRIEKQIESGTLTPLTEAKPGDCIYRRMLKKNP